MHEGPTRPDTEERTHLAFEAANRRDIDKVMSFFAPDAVVAGQVWNLFEGRGAIRGFFDDWFGAFPELRFEVEEFVALDDGVVLVVVSQVGRPVGADSPVHQQEGWVIRWSTDGFIVRLTTYADIDEARSAAEPLAG